MSELIIAGIIELAKMGLSIYFQSMRMAGKSEEEIQSMYEAEKAEFYVNKPEDLPDV